MGFLSNLFSKKPAIDLAELIAKKAIIVDVRTKSEFQTGHIKGSINIPLQNINNQLSKLPKNKTIITCCASGSRSSAAKRVLQSNRYESVYNGGSWHKVNQYI